jgi:hypothetical protein
MRPGAAPIGEQILAFLLTPPIMASLVWLMSRGWAHTVQGELVSDVTKKRQKFEFWLVLVVLYLFAIGLALFEWLA